MGEKGATPTSLRALAQPIALASIAILLLNDHVLKAVTPSALTGKVSDFAGLFFFPFVMTALIGTVTDRLGLQPRYAAVAAFALTAAWFAGIKTLPIANRATVAIAQAVLDAPVQIVLDPTDVAALLALLPAWRLWRKAEALPSAGPVRLSHILALGVASLASLATSPAADSPDPSVRRLVIGAGARLYATEGYGIYESTDGGASWQARDADEIPSLAVAESHTSRELPYVACSIRDPNMCYRVSGTEVVETSEDGGATWAVAWSLPPGRRDFMVRVRGSAFDLGPYDVIMLDKAETYVVVAAMGSDGLLRRDEQGVWSRMALGSAYPTPYHGQGLSLILSEMFILLVVAVLGLAAVTLSARIRLLRDFQATPGDGRDPRWVDRPGWAVLGLILIVALAIWILLIIIEEGASPILLALSVGFALFLVLWFLMSPVMISAGLFWTWSRLAAVSRDPRGVRRARNLVFLSTVGAVALGTYSFKLWLSGAVTEYDAALLASVFTVAICLGFGVRATSIAVRAQEQAARNGGAI